MLGHLVACRCHGPRYVEVPTGFEERIECGFVFTVELLLYPMENALAHLIPCSLGFER
jgi:hypothetical protein